MYAHTKGIRLVAAVLGLGVAVAAATAVYAGDPKANKDNFTRFVDEVLNKGNVAMFDELTSPDFVEHEAMPPGMAEGRDGCKQLFSMFHSAFPDLKVTIDDLLAEGDKIVARETWTGTNKGEFMGMPATGKKVTFNVIDIVRFKDGKAVEHWGVTDRLAMMEQLHPEMMSKSKEMPMKEMPKAESKSGN